MITTNCHHPHRAEAADLIPSDCGTVKFYTDAGHVTVFLPYPVCVAVADAFTKAMAAHDAADRAEGGVA